MTMTNLQTNSMKHSKTDIAVLLLMLGITVATVISVIVLKNRATENVSAAGYEDAVSLNSIVLSSLYTMNSFQMSYLQNFVIDNKHGERQIFSKVIKQPSLVLFISEDFCPICIETIMKEYYLSASDTPLFVIFNNISKRELRFRSDVFNDATCLSMPAENLFYENLQTSQLLLYLSEDMYIEGVLAPFSGMNEDVYKSFFTKKFK